jgi:hypothetical protein
MVGGLSAARYLQVVGFSMVALSATGLEILFGKWFDLVSQAQTISVVTMVIANGVFALATWSWFSSLEANLGSGRGMTRPLRNFSVAYLISAVGYLAYTYAIVHDDMLQPYDGRRAIAIAVACGVEFTGFCLVTSAYWTAASELRTPADSEDDVRVPLSH